MKTEKPEQLWKCPCCGTRFLSREKDPKCSCKCSLKHILEGRSIRIYFQGPPKKALK